MKQRFTHGHQQYEIDLLPASQGFRLKEGEREREIIPLEAQPGRVAFRLDEGRFDLEVALDGDLIWVAWRGHAFRLEKTRSRGRRVQSGGENPQGVHRAPMPGQVRAVQVGLHEAVKKGQTMMILEAMKMEIRIQAACDGVVTGLPVSSGDPVEKEQALIIIE